jgi:hypothetical protein
MQFAASPLLVLQSSAVLKSRDILLESTAMNYEFVVLAHQPNTIRQYTIYTKLVSTMHRIVPWAYRDPVPESLGGHYGVTRSLNAGFRALGIHFAYAPPLHETTARTAIVLAGVTQLKAAMAWRSHGGCSLLFAGPNVAESPHDHGGILLSPEIDRVIVPSNKVRLEYESLAPQLLGRVCVWPAGVDEKYWQPTGTQRRDGILIYNKRMSQFANHVFSRLSESGFQCQIINYGEKRRDRYRPHQFRSALERARVCVLLALNESQGIAPCEAWSMGVPTLAYRAPGYETVETVPYLTPATGAYWSSMEELLAILKGMQLAEYQPRKWVLENMTDARSAAHLMALANQFHSRSDSEE